MNTPSTSNTKSNTTSNTTSNAHSHTKIVIIGAGISGLSAGIFAQMNGFASEIYEHHTVPGGVCTGWWRNGYYFDGCIHWLVGTNPSDSLHALWQLTHALTPDISIVDHVEFCCVIHGEKELHVYSDMDHFESELMRISPEDSEQIHDFITDIKSIANPTEGKPNYGPIFAKYGKKSVKDFCATLTNSDLQELMENIFGIEEFPMVSFILTMGYLHQKNAGWPIGGALPFAQRMAARYVQLGGKIHYSHTVEEIIVENNQARGLRLANGTEIRGDIVISAADGYSVLFKMLKEKYMPEDVRDLYHPKNLFTPLLQISFGVDANVSQTPHSRTFMKSIQLGPCAIHGFSIRHYGFDSTVAPRGKSVITLLAPTDYDFWKALAGQPEAYKAAKKEIMRDACKILAEVFPNVSKIQEKVEVVDVATPLTTERYTLNWRGSFEGFRITTELMGKKIPKTLPNLQNFYMIGQWTSVGGGLPPALLDGMQIINIIKKS